MLRVKALLNNKYRDIKTVEIKVSKEAQEIDIFLLSRVTNWSAEEIEKGVKEWYHEVQAAVYMGFYD